MENKTKFGPQLPTRKEVVKAFKEEAISGLKPEAVLSAWLISKEMEADNLKGLTGRLLVNIQLEELYLEVGRISDAREIHNAVWTIISNAISEGEPMPPELKELHQRSSDLYYMIEDAEKNKEKIPSKDEVLEIISRYAENATFVRKLSDERGLYLLEVKVEGKEKGEVTEYMYMRKGIYPNKNETLETAIHAVYYQDDMPVGGDKITVYNSETGEWQEVK